VFFQKAAGMTGPQMIEDLPEIREELNKHWQTASVDLIKRGFRPQAVLETMFTVGLAGYVELHGRDAAAQRLLFIAQRFAEQAQQEAEAIAEAETAVRN
jgi:hypothetical protein